MSPAQTLITILIIVVVLVALAVVGSMLFRRRRLQARFGPEYERVVAEHEGRLAGERALRDRERRHDELELRDLDEATRRRFAERWQQVQAQFVDDPAQAVVAGDALFGEIVAARGYPAEGDERLEALSVEHARPLGHYRDAHQIFLRSRDGRASTEDLRQALVHYREIIGDILGSDALGQVGTAPGPASDPRVDADQQLAPDTRTTPTDQRPATAAQSKEDTR
jgi:hypothetical protein